jgi:alkylation response protein AidB-like acyl-CoA dehydrogenase
VSGAFICGLARLDFSLNEDQIMIRDAAENFLADVSDSAAVRKAMASERGYDESVWQRIAGELGWCGIAVPEEHGAVKSYDLGYWSPEI